MSDESQDNVTPFPASAAPDLPQSVVDALVACNDACNAAAGQIMEAMTQVLTTLELTEVTHGALPRYGHMMRGLEVALSHDLRLLLETELPALWSRKHAPQS